MNIKYLSLTLAVVLSTGCGPSSKSSIKSNDGEGSIDFREYYPKESISKTFRLVERDGDDVYNFSSIENIEVVDNTITTTIDTEVVEKVVFTDKNITTSSFYDGKTDIDKMYRHIDLGDTVFTAKVKSSIDNALGQVTTTETITCKAKSKEERFEKSDHIYTGDLLKIECISEGTIVYDIKQAILDAGAATDLNGTHNIYDTSYVYMKKDLGLVATIDNDCVTNSKIPGLINDKAAESECIKKQYQYEFYIP